jgi:uncharacterized membrane protein
MNPARTLGPDVVAANFSGWWVYVAGHLAGACIAVTYIKLVGDLRTRPRSGTSRAKYRYRPTGRTMSYNDVIEKIGTAIDAAGVAVIVAGAMIASVACIVRLSRRERDVYRGFRQRLGQTILLGLELLVAGDIVRTVAASPTLTSVAILAAIVAIRTFLSFSLEVEINGRWPWQKRDVVAP